MIYKFKSFSDFGEFINFYPELNDGETEQFTNIYDTNGEEIFTGDIVLSVDETQSPKELFGDVKMDRGSYRIIGNKGQRLLYNPMQQVYKLGDQLSRKAMDR